MNESRHTPGPWQYVKRPERFRIEDKPSQPAIADVYRIYNSEGEANACLIAAAPDLLAACEAALRYDAGLLGRAARGEVDLLEKGGGTATGDDLDALYFDWQEKARAAIAKAKGEPVSYCPECRKHFTGATCECSL